MLELLAIALGLLVAVLLPIEASKVCNGWMRPSFKGSIGEFRAAYLKQVTYFMWLGVGIGLAHIVIATLNVENGGWLLALVAMVIWFAVGGIGYHFRGKIARLPA